MSDGPADDPAPDLTANLERFCGFADVYDAYRPTPPDVIASLLGRLAGTDRPALVVDIGSGTGLSTWMWAERADAVIGIEPNPDMRRQAEDRAYDGAAPRVRFQDGLSSATGLLEGCADIVTCSQALHWLEPVSTFAEAARILRPGGVFAAYDCDWPPTVSWEAEMAYDAAMERGIALLREREAMKPVVRWKKSEHLARMRASGRFRYTKELAVHHLETGDADRFVGIALSQGSIARLLLAGITEEEIGIDTLRRQAMRFIGPDPVPWFWTYRIRIGVR